MNFKYAELSKKQKSIYQLMKSLNFDLSALSLAEFAKLSQSSENTVLSLCKKMGYPGYKDLRYACNLNPDLRFSLTHKDKLEEDNSLRPYYKWQYKSMKNLERLLGDADTASFMRHANKIVEAREVVSFGHNVSAIPSQFLHHRLSLMRIKATACQLGLGSDLSLTLGRLNREDLVILFSFKPYYQPISKILQYAKSHKVPVLTVTDSLDSPAAAGPENTIITQTAVPIFDNSLITPVAIVEILSTLVALNMGSSAVQIIKENSAIGAYIFGDKLS